MKNVIYLILYSLVILISCDGTKTNSVAFDDALEALTPDEFLEHLGILSADIMMGRETGEPGYDSASSYIIDKIKTFGLKPGGVSGTYKQPITFTETRLIKNSINAIINGDNLELGSEFVMSPLTTIEDVDIDAPLVFAGFGIEAPELNYNDFEDLDVSGKVAIVVSEAPSTFSMVERAVLTNNEMVQNTLIAKGAIGVITVFPESYENLYSWPLINGIYSSPKLRYVSDKEEIAQIPGFILNYRKAAEILKTAGKDYKSLMETLSKGEPVSFDLGINVSFKAKFKHKTKLSHNVAAILEGCDPDLKDEYLIMTAHLDHLGTGRPVNGDTIYNGTWDNASGSSAILTLAHKFSSMEAPKRSIMFLWVTGEEHGLLGSEYFAKYPTLDADQIVANQNLDGIVGLINESSDVIAFGYEHSQLAKSIDFAVNKMGVTISKDPYPEQNFFVRSDQYSFVKEGYPAIWVVSGMTAMQDSVDGHQKFNEWMATRYHKPSDDMMQPMDFNGIEKELKINFLVAYHIANQLESTDWIEESFLYKRFIQKDLLRN